MFCFSYNSFNVFLNIFSLLNQTKKGLNYVKYFSKVITGLSQVLGDMQGHMRPICQWQAFHLKIYVTWDEDYFYMKIIVLDDIYFE